MITLRKERRAKEDGILEALRRNTTATANLQHEASEIGVGLAGAGSETKGASRNRRAKRPSRGAAPPPLNATATAAAGGNQLLRRVRATRRAANSFLCPHQHRLASRLSYLPPAVRDRATPAAGVNALASLNPKRPAGALSPPILNSSQPPSAPPKAA